MKTNQTPAVGDRILFNPSQLGYRGAAPTSIVAVVNSVSIDRRGRVTLKVRGQQEYGDCGSWVIRWSDDAPIRNLGPKPATVEGGSQ